LIAPVWRLTPPRYAQHLDGEGARLVGGRWNSPGRPALYTSSHLSLAVLEVFVHLAPELRDMLPELDAVRIAVPSDQGVVEIEIEQFEGLMAASDPLAACRRFGDDWLSRASELVLKAPSVLVPEDPNLILNPLHPGMRQVEIESSRRFRFDPRMVRAV
jgi:RES domain-containing protein